jgi:uridine phosphorylase
MSIFTFAFPMSPAELPLNADGSVYHLAARPQDVAPNIVLVGDPDRVALFEPLLDGTRARGGKREFQWLTGHVGAVPLTVLSTGIGTDNVEIVLTELDAAFAFDLNTRQPLTQPPILRMLRIGTCGAVHPNVPPGTFILSDLALGLDALGPYYPTHATFRETGLHELTYPLFSELPPGSPLYVAESNRTLTKALLASARLQPLVRGLTLTCPGFYHPQARTLGRARTTLGKWWDTVTTFQYDGLRIENLEMETAGLFRMARALGHHAASLSVALAGRSASSFHSNPTEAVQHVIAAGLYAFVEACQQPVSTSEVH